MKNEEDYLLHYGVLGMKWGVRRANRGSSKSTSSKRKKKESVKNLSDEELNRRIRRLRMEKEYNDLKGRGSSKAKKAMSAVGNFLMRDIVASTASGIGRDIARNYLGGQINDRAGMYLVKVAEKKKK